MKIRATAAPKLFWVTLFLIPLHGFAQTGNVGQFSCGQEQNAALSNRDLKFAELISLDSMKQWRSRPVLVFDGFDAARFGFKRTEFYRWHVPVPGREGYDQGAMSNSTDRLALAVRIVGPRGEIWFELANPADDSDHSLYIQQRVGDESGENSNETNPQSGSTAGADEMKAWLRLQTATPDSKLPLFRLSYQHDESGIYQTERIDHHLLLDLQTGSPHIINALTCTFYEPIGGACSAQDQAAAGHNTLQCEWDGAARDFRCTMTSPYGGFNAARTAQRDFYLLSGKTAKPSAEHADFLPGLGQLALRIRENPMTQTKRILVTGLGPVALLQHFKDLLPDADVFVFASPGAGGVWNARLSLVTVSSAGKLDVQAIPKWGISGEAMDESEPPRDLLPLKAEDSYRTHILEQRPGFRAFDAILTAVPGQTNLGHVLYWIGLEVADGKLVASAVRLASDGYAYGGCGQEFHEGTATLIRRKAACAEATIRAQGQFNSEYTNPYPTEGANCVWTSLLHWKPGAGFRARKLSESCDAAHQEITITEDGAVKSQDSKSQ